MELSPSIRILLGDLLPHFRELQLLRSKRDASRSLEASGKLLIAVPDAGIRLETGELTMKILLGST